MDDLSGEQAFLGQEGEGPPPKPVLDDNLEILDVISSGGMGSVYRARHVELDRVVAVKVLHRCFMTGPGALDRFRREAAVYARLEHPSIVRVHYVGVSVAGEPFIVMELLAGRALSEILRTDGSLALPRFYGIFRQLVSGLRYAHERGVIHRDIKPGNIIVALEDEREVPRLIDFGIAKSLDESLDQRLTQTGVLLGTSLYMSPEQCAGDIADVTSDIYSLGCVMYETLTGRPAFSGKSDWEVMYKHLHGSLSSLEWKAIPPPLARMVLKCLQRSPDRRFQSAAELERELISGETGCTSRSNRLALAVWTAILVVTLAVATCLAISDWSRKAWMNAAARQDSSISGGLPDPQRVRVPRPVKELKALVDRYKNRRGKSGQLQSEPGGARE